MADEKSRDEQRAADARPDPRLASPAGPSPYATAGPTLSVQASIEGGDDRHGIEVLIGDTVHASGASDDNRSVSVEGVPWDSQVTVRPLARPRAGAQVRPEDLPEGSLEQRQARQRIEAEEAERSERGGSRAEGGASRGEGERKEKA